MRFMTAGTISNHTGGKDSSINSKSTRGKHASVHLSTTNGPSEPAAQAHILQQVLHLL